MDVPETKPRSTPFEKFKRFAERIVAVPKREADELARREKAKKERASPSDNRAET